MDSSRTEQIFVQKEYPKTHLRPIFRVRDIDRIIAKIIIHRNVMMISTLEYNVYWNKIEKFIIVKNHCIKLANNRFTSKNVKMKMVTHSENNY